MPKKKIQTKKKGGVKFASVQPDQHMSTAVFGGYSPSSEVLDFHNAWWKLGFPDRTKNETTEGAQKAKDEYAAARLLKAINKRDSEFFLDLGLVLKRMYEAPVDPLRVSLAMRARFQRMGMEKPPLLCDLLKEFGGKYSDRTITRACKATGCKYRTSPSGRPKKSVDK